MNTSNLESASVVDVITILPSTTLQVPLIAVEGAAVCSFCPNGLPVPDPARRFINVPDDALNCGGFEEMLLALETDEECNATLSLFQTSFDPGVFCHCPTAIPTGVCQLCNNDSHVGNMDSSNDTAINGVLCSDYMDLAAATMSVEFCQSIQSVIGIEACCGVTQITNTTTASANTNATFTVEKFHVAETNATTGTSS
ncbi:expressed unknown protein [Seminavis robusta]|uniref:Uncharacterized protein n=1 Tax=Seminavis robusta TaxID=568900 RepID=A0A9N8HXW3_9STRA|nr:expressed unknown protein [Seminavis robusta]|eukprot:Sro1881_g303330.1 n/a (198) ;mRNA; r:14547-15140